MFRVQVTKNVIDAKKSINGIQSLLFFATYWIFSSFPIPTWNPCSSSFPFLLLSSFGRLSDLVFRMQSKWFFFLFLYIPFRPHINGDNLDVSFYTCYSMHLLANLYVNNNVMALCKTSNTLTKMFGDDKWCPRNDIQRRSQSPPSYPRFICNIRKISMNCVSTLSNANEFWPRWQRMESTALCVHLAWNEGALNDMVFASRWTNYTRFSCMDWASLVVHVVNNIRELNFEYPAIQKKKQNRKNRLVIQRTSLMKMAISTAELCRTITRYNTHRG